MPPLESKQASLLHVFTLSCNCRGPNKALPEFLLIGEGQESLSMGFSRQEYWSGLPFPLPGDLPDPQIEPVCLTCPALGGRLFTAGVTREARFVWKPLRNGGAAKLGDYSRSVFGVESGLKPQFSKQDIKTKKMTFKMKSGMKD